MKTIKLIIAFVIFIYGLFFGKKQVGIPSHEKYTTYVGSAHYNCGRRSKFKSWMR